MGNDKPYISASIYRPEHIAMFRSQIPMPNLPDITHNIRYVKEIFGLTDNDIIPIIDRRYRNKAGGYFNSVSMFKLAVSVGLTLDELTGSFDKLKKLADGLKTPATTAVDIEGITEHLKSNLLSLRIHYRFSRKQLSEVLGCTASNIAFYEIGRSTPKIDLLLRYKSLFSLNSIHDLFTGELPGLTGSPVTLGGVDMSPPVKPKPPIPENKIPVPQTKHTIQDRMRLGMAYFGILSRLCQGGCSCQVLCDYIHENNIGRYTTQQIYLVLMKIVKEGFVSYSAKKTNRIYRIESKGIELITNKAADMRRLISDTGLICGADAER